MCRKLTFISVLFILTIYWYVFYYSVIWCNNKIIHLYFNRKGEVSTSAVPLYMIVALPVMAEITGQNML